MTNDSKLFPPLPKWEAQGYQPDEYGHWLKGRWRPSTDFGLPGGLPTLLSHDQAATILQRPGVILNRDATGGIRIEDIEDVAVPLYEGRMIGQFDFSQKGWVRGKGRTAVWHEMPWQQKWIEPQFLMGLNTFFDETLERHLTAIAEAEDEQTAALERVRLSDLDTFMKWWAAFDPRTCFMDVSSATNTRGMISATVRDFPAGNKTPILQGSKPLELGTVLNSFAYDFTLRRRLVGLSLNYFIIEETPLPLSSAAGTALASLNRRLTFISTLFARHWCRSDAPRNRAWLEQWAITDHERIRLRCVADAVVANSFGLSIEDFAWLLQDCDHPSTQLKDKSFARRLDPKGFWRVGRQKIERIQNGKVTTHWHYPDPELRHTVLAQVAYADLQRMGLEAFLTGPDGDGWQLPETLRLADYNLGHDERAREPQPVASRLGPRFLDWQLAKDPAQSWAECEAHAAQLDALWKHARSLVGGTEPFEQSEHEAVVDSAPRKPKKRGENQPEFQF